jgi:hypothetical protein
LIRANVDAGGHGGAGRAAIATPVFQ